MTKRHGFQYDRIFGKKEWYIEELDFDKAEQSVSTDLHFPRYYGIKSEEHAKKLCDLLNRQHKEITQLKETIIKITHSYHQKHDNTIVNLVDEVYGENIGYLFIEWNHGDVE